MNVVANNSVLVVMMAKSIKNMKSCNFCKHAQIFGLHAVKIKCAIHNIEMYGYTKENEYAKNAKNCNDFEKRN